MTNSNFQHSKEVLNGGMERGFDSFDQAFDTMQGRFELYLNRVFKIDDKLYILKFVQDRQEYEFFDA